MIDAPFWIGLALSALVGVTLGFFGGGGSVLMVPLFVYVFGFEAKQAIASSLGVVATASLMAAWQHARARRVDLRIVSLFGVAGMVGAYLGGRASARLDGDLLLLLFVLLMTVTSIAMWRGRSTPVGLRAQDIRASIRLAGQGFSVGLVTGLLGAGGGFLIVPALTLWAGLDMATAVGTSLAIIVLNALAGLTGYVTHVRIDLWPLLWVAAAAGAGAFAGAKIAGRVPQAALRRGFAGVVFAAAAVMTLREAPAWWAMAEATVRSPKSPWLLVLAVVLFEIGYWIVRARRRAVQRFAYDPELEQGAGI